MLKHSGTQIINTEKLTLRPFQYTDANDMLTYWVSDPDIQLNFQKNTSYFLISILR